MFYVHLSQAFDDDIGAALTQGLTLLAVIDADHASEAAPFAGFDPSQRILEQNCTRRLNVKAACGLKKQCRIRLARQPERLRVKPVDANIEMMFEPRSMQNGGWCSCSMSPRPS